MRGASPAHVALSFVGLLLAASCGGGYGGGHYAAGPSRLLMQVTLDGGEETSVVDANASATAVLDLVNDGTLTFAATGEAAWVASVTGMKIHLGFAGANGPVSVDLFSGGASFDPVTRTAEGTLAISTALAGQILSTPSYYYLNIETSDAPQGLVRAQLAAAAPVQIHATLLGSHESPVADATAQGSATFSVGTDRSVHCVLAMANPVAADVTQAHVHVGDEGIGGLVLVDLAAVLATVDAAAGTLTGDVVVPVGPLCRILQDISGFYVNVHTASAPAGVARGQLESGTVGLWAPLLGSKETVIVDPSARGGVTLDLESFTGGRAIFAVPPAQGIAAVTGAHVHLGGAGSSGAIFIDLRTGPDFSVDAPTGSAEGAIALTQPKFARLLANPTGFYADIHTAAAPNGLARGQMTRTQVTFRALMSGALETTPVDPSAAGSLRLLVSGAHAASFDVDMTSPAPALVNGAHVHAGTVGVNGPIAIDLLGGTGVTTFGSHITGDVTFTGRTFAAMLAAPERFYGNVHTASAPAGIARGQCFRVTDDSPPAGLAYTTPVVYVTASPIGPNVPTSSGGAVASYSISPGLPAGLGINTTTGVIVGTPSAVAPGADYTVTATNTAGSTTATVHVTVNVAPPAGLSYTTPVTYVVNTAITANTPSSTGGAIASYSVSPGLPAGLSLNTSTGVISGTPTSATSAADYTVTGSNASGSTQATVHITVDATLQAPSGLSYSTPVTYSTGYAITNNAPTIGGGPPDSYGVSPALPSGLTLNTTTGVISGTPTTVTTATNYTVTATNAAGSTNATVNITVILGAPTGLSYSNNPNLGYVMGGYFATMNPTVGGGAVSSYGISPSLPAGISINASTGVISGTPTATSSQTTYTVTASNSAGSTTASVTITIY